MSLLKDQMLSGEPLLAPVAISDKQYLGRYRFPLLNAIASTNPLTQRPLLSRLSQMVYLAEFERDLIRERTNAGLEAARARGKKGGRKRVLTDKQISIGKSLAADKSRSVEDICETLKISPATYYRYIHHQV